VAGGFGAEGEDGAAEFVADGDGEFFFCYGVGGYWGEVGTGEVFVEVCSADSNKSRLYPHLSFHQLLRRRRDIVLDPDILFAVVSRGTHLVLFCR